MCEKCLEVNLSVRKNNKMSIFKKRLKSHHDASMRLRGKYVSETDKKQYLINILNSDAQRKRVLYIHIPYCKKICTFCSFPQGDKKLIENYHNIIIEQIKSQRVFKYMEKPFSSIYFGGGTPTYLSPSQLTEILGCLYDSFNFTDDCEISIETSINDLSTEMIDALLKNKVNRLSIGVQSFDDNMRKVMGRVGSGEKAINKILEAKKAGFKNVNIDLIYNCPGETLDILQSDIDTIIDLELAGISFYSLILFDDSRIKKIMSEEEYNKMNDINYEYEQFSLILEKLKRHGYEMFEFTKIIRNKIDKYKYVAVSQNMGDCIALGHGSGGNIANYTYMNTFEHKPISTDVPISFMGSVLDDKYYIINKFINDLQNMTVDLNSYNSLLKGGNLETLLSSSIEKYVNEDLLIYENGRLTTTEKGIFWGNNMIDGFVKEILQNTVCI